jgi:predicted nucleotidyltransferase component of viral defense system
MHPESLTKNTESVLDALDNSGVTKNFYLAGGTALALYFGHRFSIDLDWFAQSFDYTLSFRQKLEKLGKLGVDSESEKTFNGSLDNVKVSFFEYPYPLIAPKTKYGKNIFLAGLPDIAAMKMEAIASRGSYKDFIDIYFLLQEYSLEQMLSFVHKKYSNIEYNEAHLLKALTYFVDAQGTQEPEMIQKTSWEEVTKKIKTEVQNYFKQKEAD